MRLLVLLAALAAATAVAAQAPPRSPMERQLLVDLAYVLGQSHALRQTCNGATDQFWRERMMRLVEAEGAEPAFGERLRRTFNAGYGEIRAQFPVCTAAVREAEGEIAGRGQALSRRLAEAR